MYSTQINADLALLGDWTGQVVAACPGYGAVFYFSTREIISTAKKNQFNALVALSDPLWQNNLKL